METRLDTGWVEANGSGFRYRRKRGAGPIVVLLHEMGGTLESWDEVASLLPASFHTIAYDMRGFGMSEKNAVTEDIDDHVADLRDILDELGVDGPVCLVGIAVGAAVAIRFSARYPGDVSHLIAMAPACGVPEASRQAVLERADALERDGLRAMGSLLLDGSYPPKLRGDSRRYDTFRLRFLSGSPVAFAATYRMLARLDLTEDLLRVPARSVFVAGIEDRFRPPAEIDRLKGLSPQAEALHAGTGHFASVQSPRFTAHLIADYVATERTAQDILNTVLAGAAPDAILA